MKTGFRYILFLYGFLWGHWAGAEPVTILPLGYSLTWGATSAKDFDNGGGYREALFEGLRDSLQYTVMVGPSDDHASPVLVWATQQFHNGFPGYRIDELANNLDADNPPWPGNYGGYWLTGISGFREPIYPDIILLMAGTNDLNQDAGAEVTGNRMAGLLYKIYQLRPTTHIILAKIPPIFGSRAYEVELFNTKIEELVTFYQQSGYRISLADQYTPFLEYGGYFGDSVHPSDKLIYRLMGFQWLPKVLDAIFHLNIAQ